MRVVFVHGRSQGGRSSKELQNEWNTALAAGYAAGEVDPVPVDVEVVVPFYGDALDEQARKARGTVEGVVTRGEVPDGEVPAVIRETLMAWRDREGVTEAEIRAELIAAHGVTATEKGPENWEWVQATARAISKHAPWLTDEFIEKFLADVDTYIKFPQQVDEIVTAAIKGDTRVVVVSHSLGTVVSYNVLTVLDASPQVPLFVTLGSPLGIPSIKKKLKGPLGIPGGVKAWFNASDERDVVALHASLSGTAFSVDGIENLTDLKNPGDNPHGIKGYLGDARVAKKIAAALSA